MTCTTFLHDGELNIPLPDKQLQELLEDVRRLTKRNWQVVPYTSYHRKWFKTVAVVNYCLYVEVGGVGPWQVINFFRDGSSSSINFGVPLELISAYLFGILAGVHNAPSA